MPSEEVVCYPSYKDMAEAVLEDILVQDAETAEANYITQDERAEPQPNLE